MASPSPWKPLSKSISGCCRHPHFPRFQRRSGWIASCFLSRVLLCAAGDSLASAAGPKHFFPLLSSPFRLPLYSPLTIPPSMAMDVPVMYLARSEARKTTRLANSSGCPTPAQRRLGGPPLLDLARRNAGFARQGLRQRAQSRRGGESRAHVVHQHVMGAVFVSQRLHQPVTPARTALERINPSTGCFTVTEVMEMKRPQRRCCIRGSASFAR